MKMINENFGIELRQDCIMFKIKKSTYKIPSKIYPLKNRRFDVFNNGNTVEVTNEKVQKLFNACKFQIGRCYANTEMLKQGSEKLEIEGIKYYSGWVFIACAPPKHHSWAVWNNSSILDGSMLQDMYTMFEELEDKGQSLTKREKANLLKNSIEFKKPNHEKFCCGKVIEPLVYMGCECTYEEAQELMRNALAVTKGNHPSYPNSPADHVGFSETQQIIKGLI